jgi:WS/DGAT/MGAT family acyltransferase
MIEMDPLDAAFLALETENMHMHVGVLAVFDTSEAGHTETIDSSVRNIISERIHTVQALRRRAIKAPLGIDFPLWIEDPHFDIRNHIYREALPTPGSYDELATMAASIMERKLDISRPLWEIHLVEGLCTSPEPATAMIAKMHHCILDGETGAGVLSTVFDDGPTPRKIAPPDHPWIPDPVPSLAELLVHSATGLASRSGSTVNSAKRAISFVANMTNERRRDPALGGIMAPLAPHLAPRTSINGAISPYRKLSFISLPLADIKMVAHSASATVNHVVLATAAGALRKLLDARGERPDRSLVSLVPVSQRGLHEGSESGSRVGSRTSNWAGSMTGGRDGGITGSRDSSESGTGRRDGNRNGHGAERTSKNANMVSAALVSLATHIDDPLDRLIAISEGSSHAIRNSSPIYDHLVKAVSQVAIPGISHPLAAAVTKLRLLDKINMPFNIVISNIRGPERPLWCAGNRMVEIYPIGPLVEGIGLNVTVMSYVDQLGIGMLACRELVPDLDDFTRYMRESFAELEKATVRRYAR